MASLHWYTIKRKDDQPFTVAGIYDDAVINGNKVRSFSMLTINSDHHPFMKQFHAPKDEKRSIIVIPEQYRKDWLTADHEHAHEYFFKCPMNSSHFHAMSRNKTSYSDASLFIHNFLNLILNAVSNILFKQILLPNTPRSVGVSHV
jgi:putative SOS response-associated peptidase YedK